MYETWISVYEKPWTSCPNLEIDKIQQEKKKIGNVHFW